MTLELTAVFIAEMFLMENEQADIDDFQKLTAAGLI